MGEMQLIKKNIPDDISKDVSATMAVFLTIILLSVICTLIGIALKKICKPLFNFLIGGRAK